MQDLHSEDNDDDSDDDDDNDVDSDADRPVLKCFFSDYLLRVSLSDGSESESSSPSPPSRNEAPPLLKTTNTQILEVKSPTKQSKQDKSKNIDCDKIVNLIEETGHFHITNTTFDFDLCSLDRSTVRKLQSYLETSGLS
uniref:AF-9 ANC1 homology domain-containing protein n=1 Tax=Acanthochromis polyacanthus TaxID=80966 RepID=A0A3Q1FJI0_9TELE